MFGDTNRDLLVDGWVPVPVISAQDTNGLIIPWEFMELSAINDKVGLPSTAMVKLRGDAPDSTNFIWDDIHRYLAGLRIKIVVNEQIFFIGELSERSRMSQAQTVGLEFSDDKMLMGKIPCHGCLVYDGVGVKHVPARNLVFNPDGMGNCVIKDNIPYFSPFAHKNYQLEPADGDPTVWTPERIIKYLHYRYVTYADIMPGTNPWNLKFLNTDKILWDISTMTFSDELRKKAPEITIPTSGDHYPRSLAGVLTKICAVAGEIDWRLDYPAGDEFQSSIVFYNKAGYTGEGLEIVCQIQGPPVDLNVAYDFHDSTSYKDTVASVQFEGQEYQIETQFEYENSVYDTLLKNWETSDEIAFTNIISGDGTHAVVDGVTQDGTGNTCKVLKNTMAAVTLARQAFPMVWRCFKLKTNLNTLLEGVSNKFAEFTDHVLQRNRPIEEQQVQGQYVDNDESDSRFDIRLELSSTSTTTAYHQVTHADGMRVTAEGLIYFDGLIENIDGQPDCLYTGSLSGAPGSVALKKIRLNAAVKHDARLTRTVTVKDVIDDVPIDNNGLIPEIHPSWLYENYEPAYYEQNESWKEHHQNYSYPAQGRSFKAPATGFGENIVPLIRIYKTEEDDLYQGVRRAVKKLCKPYRTASWKYISIQPFRAGDWVTQVKLVPDDAGLEPVPINAPISQSVMTWGTEPHTQISLEGY